MSMRYLLILLQCFLFLFFNRTTSTSSRKLCLHDQSLALLQLKQSFSIRKNASAYDPSYPKLTSWKDGTDCCSWDGVECDEDTGNVIGLNLSSSWLFGPINSNSSLFYLRHLKTLNLADNHFNWSSIPSTFDRLVSLTHLNLSYSIFSGQIPLEISRLTNLVSLDLSKNDLELENPNLRTLVQNLSSLRELFLSDTNISTQVNRDWCQVISFALPNLEGLGLSRCSLSGPIDIRFRSHVYLDETDITHFPNNVLQLPNNLKILDLRYNQNLSACLPEFPRDSSLQHLILSVTNLSGKVPHSIGNLTQLISLDLSSNNLNGQIPVSLLNLHQLVSLGLSNNNFSGPIPSALFTQLPSLERLYLSQNRFSGELEEFHNASSSLLVTLDLSYNELKGPIPSALFTQLPSLESLYLSQNRLSGELEEFHNVSSSLLVTLDLSYNELKGPIPSALFTQLPSLERLYLSQNRLSGELEEFHNASSSLLVTLDLSYNELKGPIPTSFFKLGNLLENLILSSNNFSGTLDPHMFENLNNLSMLDLSYNELLSISTDDIISPMPNFKYFYFSSCNVSKFPKFLINQRELIVLDLSNNTIQGQIPNWIWKTNLEYLNLSQNLLTELQRPNLSSSRLGILDLHSNKLQSSLQNFPPSIFLFSISSNKVTGEISPSICNATQLGVLNLSYNQMSGMIPPCLANITNTLFILDVQGNNFHGTMPQNFADECALQTLKLNDNQLKGQVPRLLAHCKKLKVLDLGNNQIADTFPFWLESIVELQVLILRSNKFHGPIGQPRINNPFPKLHIIDLSSNNFIGNLPSEYFRCWNAMMIPDEVEFELGGSTPGSNYSYSSSYYQYSLVIANKGYELEYVMRMISILKIVDLSSNRFEGEIPELMGNLKWLTVLNLSHNNLIGKIPSSLQNLTVLESLDLSQNKLSGEIPWQLTSLTFLSVLNLSHNKLVGKIPRGAQFNTFSDSSFEGNLGLCGDPLPIKCEHRSEAVPPPQHFDAESETEFDWIFMLAGYGSGLVVGVVIEHFFLWRKRCYFLKVVRIGRFLQNKTSKKTRNASVVTEIYAVMTLVATLMVASNMPHGCPSGLTDP